MQGSSVIVPIGLDRQALDTLFDAVTLVVAAVVSAPRGCNLHADEQRFTRHCGESLLQAVERLRAAPGELLRADRA